MGLAKNMKTVLMRFTMHKFPVNGMNTRKRQRSVCWRIISCDIMVSVGSMSDWLTRNIDLQRLWAISGSRLVSPHHY